MRYTIANFPFKTDNQTDSLERCSTPIDTMISVVTQFLKTRKRSRLGKNVGSILPDMLYNLYTNDSLTSYSSLVKQDLIEQFPEFTFHSLYMEMQMIDGISTLVVRIEISSIVTDITQFEILFPKTKEQ